MEWSDEEEPAGSGDWGLPQRTAAAASGSSSSPISISAAVRRLFDAVGSGRQSLHLECARIPTLNGTVTDIPPSVPSSGRFDGALQWVERIKDDSDAYTWLPTLELLPKHFLPAEEAIRSCAFSSSGTFLEIRAKYDVLIEKLQFVASMRDSRRYTAVTNDAKELDTLHSHLVIIARTRREILDVYANMSESTDPDIQAADDLERMRLALEQADKLLHPETIGKFKRLFVAELSALRALLGAHTATFEHDFMKTTIWLCKAKAAVALLYSVSNSTRQGAISPGSPLHSVAPRDMHSSKPLPAAPTAVEYLAGVLRRQSQRATLVFHHLLDSHQRQQLFGEVNILSAAAVASAVADLGLNRMSTVSKPEPPPIKIATAFADADSMHNAQSVAALPTNVTDASTEPGSGGRSRAASMRSLEDDGWEELDSKVELVKRIANYQTNAGAQYAVVLRSLGGAGQSAGRGYVHPDMEIEQATGLRSFPAVFVYPRDALSSAHHAALFMIKSEYDHLLQAGNAVCIDESEMYGSSKGDRGSSYYLVLLDSRTVAAVVFANKGRRKGDAGAKSFLSELRATVTEVWRPV